MLRNMVPHLPAMGWAAVGFAAAAVAARGGFGRQRQHHLGMCG